jgi:hypothetical protein
VNIQVTGGLANGVVHVWRSNRWTQFLRLADAIPVNNRFKISLDPDAIYLLTTTTGQPMGTGSAPQASVFRLPYRDDFESYSLGSKLRYFSDQGRIFGAGECRQRGGKCLRQVMPQKGTDWRFHPTPEPETILGDLDWVDYRVSVDVNPANAGFASLFARIGAVPQNASRPDSYELSFHQKGDWSLKSYVIGTANLLASGHVRNSPKPWHNLELGLKGSRIVVRIDH